jgi:photosystem II stability/assembly factor-like uncharacterized protein
VGDSGKIFHTTNGGNYWELQNSETPENLYGVYFINVDTGCAVGLNGKILRTTNGGSDWDSVPSGTPEHLCGGVYFADAQMGWAVGDMGTILHTTDGGANWGPQTSGTSQMFLGVYFTDADTGWTVGGYGTILHTTDGGSNWNPQSSGTLNRLEGIYFTDSKTGWAVGDYGTILHTTNGGSTWVEEDNNSVELPKDFSLAQNYPNPFNPQTTIQYTLTKKSRVTLKIYNLLGQKIRTLVDEFRPSGNYIITWDGKGNSGETLASGIYFYRLTMERNDIHFSETKKMVLLK